MIYSGEEDIPLLMFLRRDSPATGKRFIQQFKVGDTQYGKLAPVRQTTAAAFTRRLVRKEVHHSSLNAIVLRLYDSLFTMIGKAQQSSLMNRRQDEFVNTSIHTSRRRMPYYMKRSPHLSIMSEPQRVNRATPLLS
jgi:hypothetical protein